MKELLLSEGFSEEIFAITIQVSKLCMMHPKGLNKAINHKISLVTIAIALYSDSAEDLKTTCCFLHFQEIRESYRNTQKPETNLLVSMQASQSASQ